MQQLTFVVYVQHGLFYLAPVRYAWVGIVIFLMIQAAAGYHNMVFFSTMIIIKCVLISEYATFPTFKSTLRELG